MSIYLQETKKESEMVLGLKEGAILKVNSIDTEQRIKYEGIVNRGVESLTGLKGKSWLAVSHSNALALYSWE